MQMYRFDTGDLRVEAELHTIFLGKVTNQTRQGLAGFDAQFVRAIKTSGKRFRIEFRLS